MTDSREEIRRKNKKVVKNVLKTVAGIGIATVATVGIISSLQKDKVIEEQKCTIDERDKEIEYLQGKEENGENEINDRKERELKIKNGEIICKVCHSSKVTEILVPCGHYAVCSSCITKLKTNNISKCPICKRRIDKAIKLYVS
ncbi:hypothetical protein H8356DRAFT_992492 [Neocallimastix lanati (nom. inval.)]|jgi:ferredoxin|uniref:RING-type domain-containing protein n=1 Tax=Neocallimastix californiae TaxID=1754190 RepID=A0A1Y2E5G0_9FUNG|nr:hypothetical protein H8356DRAFT_992492 [Neocallimastix sp. JGI-2020a]ORY66759.1 hypothetical protein LY90DRAFT_700644 [Neocallimastix californiae]|eukprot:ORY66759.1 hypothetical protein LY90DRAFT_700644 [Neocallimastix californiae]